MQTKTPVPPADRMLTRRDVEVRVGLSGSTIYDAIKRGTFPRPVKVGVRAVRWSESEIEAWLADRQRGGGEPTPLPAA